MHHGCGLRIGVCSRVRPEFSEQINEPTGTHLGYGERVPGATKAGNDGSLGDVFIGLDVCELRLVPHSSSDMPCFVPLLHITNTIVSFLAMFHANKTKIP